MQLTAASTGGLSPEQYVAQLRQQGKITGAQGQSETIGGWPAWVGRVGIQDDQGNSGTLAFAMIATGQNQALQILGQGDENAVIQSARSLRRLTDSGRLSALPARVKIVAAPRAGSFASLIGGMGTQGASVAELAILNGVEQNESIAQGRLLKTVLPPKLR